MRDWQDPVATSCLLARCLEKQARWVGRKGLRVLMYFETRSMAGTRVGAEGVGVSSWLHV